MSKKSDDVRESADLVQFKLRMREELRAKIESAAAQSGKSMNAEIVDRLEASFRDDAIIPPHARPAVMGIAYDLARLEARRGKRWTEDRVIAHAMGAYARDAFLYGTEPENWSAIEAAMARLNALKEKLRRRCGYLQEIGFLRTKFEGAFAHTLAAECGYESFPLPPDEMLPARSMALFIGLEPNVNLREAPETWSLAIDDRQLTNDEKCLALVTFMGIGQMHAELEEIRLELDSATEADDAAKAEAERIVAAGRGENHGA